MRLLHRHPIARPSALWLGRFCGRAQPGCLASGCGPRKHDLIATHNSESVSAACGHNRSHAHECTRHVLIGAVDISALGMCLCEVQVVFTLPRVLGDQCLRIALAPSLHLPCRRWEAHPDFASILDRPEPYAPTLRLPEPSGEVDPALRARAIGAFVEYAASRGSLAVTLCVLRPQHGLVAALRAADATSLTSVSVTILVDPSAPLHPQGMRSCSSALHSICRLTCLQRLRVGCVLSRPSEAQQRGPPHPPGAGAVGKQIALALATGLSYATGLTDVMLCTLDVNGRAGRMLIEAVLRLPSLQQLRLHGCNFARSSLHVLMHGAGACTALTGLECVFSASTMAFIDSEAAAFVDKATQVSLDGGYGQGLLSALRQVSVLGLRANAVPLEGGLIQPYHMPMFMPHLAACANLTQLCIGPVCRDNSMHIAALGSAIGELQHLRLLAFEQLYTDTVGMRCIADGVSRLRHLSHLSMWRCRAPHAGLYALISSTHAHGALRALRLVAVAAVTSAATAPPPDPALLRAGVLSGLESLALPFNRTAAWLGPFLRGGGGPAGEQLLQCMPTLRALNLAGSVSCHGASCTAANVFAQLLHLSHLTAVDLRQNRFVQADAEALAAALLGLTALRVLDVSVNRFRDKGILAIAAAIAAGSASGLRELRVAGCAFGHVGTLGVIEAARSLPRLRLLVLGLVPRCALRHELLTLLEANPDLVVDCARASAPLKA